MTVKFTKAGTLQGLLRPAPGHGRRRVTVAKKGADGPDGQAGRRRRQEAGRRRGQGRQGPRQDQPGRQHRRPRRRRPRAASSTSAWSRPRSPSRKGTTVKFQMTKGTYEAHTATFGPGNIEDPKSYLGGDRGLVRVARDRPARRLPERRRRRSSLSPTTARQRLLELGRARRRQARRRCPSPSSVKFDTARHLHVLLPDPPLHARYRHRPVRRLTTVLIARGGEPARRPVGVRGHPRVLGGGGARDLEHRPQRPRRDHGDGVHAGRHGLRHVVYRRYTSNWRKPLRQRPAPARATRT